ncbi:heme exporter protein CcmD [Ruegeria profundi]|uniref:heme exporter protein CcmD n=1 Tax=Ruegeria profundi TaxID=1685378 RepID=UPI001CD618A7|nr:heme exporter protein CcmD [Ruegeria profundi]MCA0927438.1 heme exporter protein CcmD [Ruegeria profundi]
MMPDLGKYADTVLWSYAASIVLLVLLLVISVARGRRVRAEMEKIEQRMTRDG